MKEKAGRNDPCPCGSGKKYKNCCLSLARPKGAGPKRKFTAKLLSTPSKPVNLIERTYSKSFEAFEKGELPPTNPS